MALPSTCTVSFPEFEGNTYKVSRGVGLPQKITVSALLRIFRRQWYTQMNYKDRKKPENIIKYINSFRKRSKSNPPLRRFFLALESNLDLVFNIELACGVEMKTVYHSRRIATAYYVSILEVYFKDIIVSKAGNWDRAGLDLLLQESIPLTDAFALFRNRSVKREHLIAHTSSFQNVAAIDRVFSVLTGHKSFLKVLTGRTGMDKSHVLYNVEIFRELEELFRLRNLIIHEGYTGRITAAKIREIHLFTFKLVLAFDAYLDINETLKT